MTLREFALSLQENILRKRNKSDIFKVKNAKFYLPLKGDHIQQFIIRKRNFYEPDFLKKVSESVNKNKLVIDAGANIGNHSIYFSKVLGTKVYSFEPQKEIFEILSKNVEINNLSGKIKLFNLGLGKKKETGYSISNQDKKNSGSAKLVKRGGDVEIDSIDNVVKGRKVGLIKIDTEGFEKDVLRGARKTIRKNRPLVWVEVSKGNRNFVVRFFKSLKYNREEKLGVTDYLFYPQ
jgi:protein O-GlcNAc transferase